jgi:hypothetical protein
MNAATIQGFRQMAREMANGTETKTAVEMALTSHKLSRSGDIATTTDGRTWYWNDSAAAWMTAR